MGMSVQTVVGFGFSLFLAPALFAVARPAPALTALLLLGILLNALLVRGRHDPVAIRWSEIRLPLAAAVPGLVLGALALRTLDPRVVEAIVGIVVVAVAL